MPSPSSLITDLAGLQAAFATSHATSRLDMAPSLAVRQQRLDALEALLRDNVNALCAAVSADFGHRSSHETQLLKIFPSLEGIRHTRRHLGAWMKPQRRPVSLWFQPARAELRPQALGCVGPSGMGQYHGYAGFQTFSKLKPVFYQSQINGIGLFNPPYGKLFERLLKLLLR